MLIDEVRECSKCGQCRSVCPIFQELNDEVMSPRGRISLIEAVLEDRLSSSERYVDTIRSCIKCMRCSSVCPVGVRMEDIIQSARRVLFEKVGIAEPAEKVFRSLLLDPPAFRSALVDVASSSSNPGSGSDLAPLWQLPLFFHEGARIPELAEEAVLDKYPEYIDAGGDKRVALFLGCSINYVHTDIADSAIEVLEKLKVDVFLPNEQLCCGAPVMLFGDEDAARELAKRNVSILRPDEFDAIVTLCPACGVAFRREYKHLLGNETGNFTSKVCDISEFIYKHTNYATRQTNMIVTYHDPCYLRLGQEVKDEPRRILNSVAQLVEMEDADKCCGLGCTLGVFHPEVSMKMSEAKINAIVDSGADAVATGCPGCIAFLRERLADKVIKKDVLHTIQIFQKGV